MAVVIELGGFRTEWAGDSLKQLPMPPHYANSPADHFRNAVFKNHGQPIGDPRKAAKALIQVAGMPNPPLRVQMGTESMAIVIGKAQETIRNAEEHAELAHSTNADGVDQDAVLGQFAMHIAK